MYIIYNKCVYIYIYIYVCVCACMLPSMWISLNIWFLLLGSSLSPVMTYSMMTGNSLGAPNGQDHGTVAIERVVPQPDIVSTWPWQSIWYKQLGHTCACIYIYIHKHKCNYNISGWWYTYPSEKYEFVSWDYDIPNIWKVIKAMFQTTNHIYI